MNSKIYSENDLKNIRDREELWLSSLPGVTGTGISLGQSGNPTLCIFGNSLSDDTKREITEKLRYIPLDWSEGNMVSY